MKRAAGATVASTVTYVIPIFSTVLGVLVLGETLHWNQPAGVLILFAGIAISQGLLRPSGRLRSWRVEGDTARPYPGRAVT